MHGKHNSVVALLPYYYRVMATNVVGDTTVYSGTIGYPNIAVNSTPSNVASVTLLPNLSTKIGVFYLRNSNSAGTADITFNFGQTGDIPVVGDWTGT